MSGVSSSTPYVSQQLKEIVKNVKAENKNEKANVVNQSEADVISKKISEETKGMSEVETKKYVEAAEKYLNSEFQNTNVKSTFKLTDGTTNLKEATKFTFNISGKIENKKEIPQESKQMADGVDFNTKEKNTLKGSPDGEKIIKRYDYLSSDKNNSLTGKPELNSASKEDLKGLKESFGNDPNKFLNALKENPKFKDAKLEDAQTILKFANEGCKSEKDVKTLQQSLKNVGPDLKERFEKNGKNGGIDGAYGFATMEGVRYLSSVVKTPEPKIDITTKDISSDAQVENKDEEPSTKKIVNWVMGCDSSSSMAPKLAMYGKLFQNEEMFNKDAKYTIGESQDLEQKVNVLAKNADSKTASDVMNKQSNFASDKGESMKESGVTQVYNMINNKPPLKEEQKPSGLMIVTDAKEQNPKMIDKLLNEAKRQGYSQITIAALQDKVASEGNRKENTMITIDLNDPKAIEAFKSKANSWDGMSNDPYLKQTKAISTIK